MKRQQKDVQHGVWPAVRWFLRFARNDISTLPSAELAEWAAWVSYPSHLQDFRRARVTWLGLDLRLPLVSRSTDAELAADDYDGSMPISEWVAKSQGKSTRRYLRNGWRRIRSGRLWTLAACLVVATTVLMLYTHTHLRFLPEWPGDQVQSYATGPSERSIITLADGSQITLGARTELSTHYTASRRIIFLDQGEAWFDVARDWHRPFTVLAGGEAITAVGTQFDVQRELDSSNVGHVTVTVDAGAVEVGPPKETLSADPVDTSSTEHPKWAPATLVKGQQITFDPSGRRGAITTADLEATSAWKEGRLEYRHTPLKTVIPQVSRYSDKPIVLADGDDALGDLPFSGTVFEGQVDDWLRALQMAYPVEVTERADSFVIRLRHDAVHP